MRIILASRSPRRREILSGLGLRFEIISADADESSELSDPTRLVKELALRKGRATRDLLRAAGESDEDTLIIAADTVVASEGRILGKPTDEEDARSMLRGLSGHSHSVISGVALLCGDRETVAAEETLVRFAEIPERDIEDYVRSGEPMDKAGAYAVQGRAALWVEGLVGDYFNVVGLPVYRLNRLLLEFLGKELTEI